MAYEIKHNTGSVFKNDRKREGKKDADYAGQGNIEGIAVWIDIWIKNDPRKEGYDSNKKTFLSLSFRPKAESESNSKPAPPTRRAAPPRPPSQEPDHSLGNERNF